MNAVKSFADGAFISQLTQLTFPGYIDGHEGAWITQPSELQTILEPYWREGFDVYHHDNGEFGLDVTPMGPIKPLLAVQTAVTRKTSSGAVLGPEQAATVNEALADFTVLEEDPYAVEPDHIGDIAVRGTVFEGRIHPH